MANVKSAPLRMGIANAIHADCKRSRSARHVRDRTRRRAGRAGGRTEVAPARSEFARAGVGDFRRRRRTCRSATGRHVFPRGTCRKETRQMGKPLCRGLRPRTAERGGRRSLAALWRPGSSYDRDGGAAARSLLTAGDIAPPSAPAIAEATPEQAAAPAEAATPTADAAAASAPASPDQTQLIQSLTRDLAAMGNRSSS